LPNSTFNDLIFSFFIYILSSIFFVFLIISIIYSIQLLHLGSLKTTLQVEKAVINKKDYRANIVDRNGNYLVKTVSSIDIGINPAEVIDKKKLLINLQLIFPNKNFSEIKNKLNSKNFFYLENNIT
jgi:cell division protein FtsI (penicillin-binding protein 3)